MKHSTYRYTLSDKAILQLKVTASDDDKEDIITYSIPHQEGVDTCNAFTVNSTTGEIILAKANDCIDYEHVKQCILQISAEDGM